MRKTRANENKKGHASQIYQYTAIKKGLGVIIIFLRCPLKLDVERE